MTAPYEHVLSVSGGKDSTALYLLAIERGRPFTAVFADTGHEHPWVYEAVAELPARAGGPPIRTVRADFTARLAGRAEYIRKHWPELGVAPDVIERAAELMQPTGSAFLDLCVWKGRFPSSSARFCTEELKITPVWEQVQRPIVAAGRGLISWQGVRAAESLARSTLSRWQRVNPAPHKALKADRDLGDAARHSYVYRPLIDWSLDDVWAMHARHGVPRNKLYDAGASRVGCLPCIFAKKDELRLIADRFPEAIERVAEWERIVTTVSKRGVTSQFVSTLFAAVDDPLYDAAKPLTFEEHGIHRRVEWARTSRGGRQYDLLAMADTRTACNEWGACE